jgi:DNA-binding NarL/FixJ family response regulator
MAVNIAIIDQNEIYRESLKTLLEQIEGFRVVLVSGDFNCSFNLLNNPVEVMLIDNSIGKQKCDELIGRALSQGNSIKTLMLAMYRDELILDYGNIDVILKNSGKKEFEGRIRELIKPNIIN